MAIRVRILAGAATVHVVLRETPSAKAVERALPIASLSSARAPPPRFARFEAQAFVCCPAMVYGRESQLRLTLG